MSTRHEPCLSKISTGQQPCLDNANLTTTVSGLLDANQTTTVSGLENVSRTTTVSGLLDAVGQ